MASRIGCEAARLDEMRQALPFMRCVEARAIHRRCVDMDARLGYTPSHQFPLTSPVPEQKSTEAKGGDVI